MSNDTRKDVPLVEGGQDRSGNEVDTSAKAMVFCVGCMILIAVVLLVKTCVQSH